MRDSVKAIAIAAFLGVHLAGCSAYMAANQPGQKDFTVLRQSTPRGRVIAELGQPINTEMKNGERHDIYTFKNGYHTGVKAGRAVLNGVASVATLGLWEVIGTPAEGYLNGTDLSVEVAYDTEDRVKRVTPLKGDDEIARYAPDAPGITAAAPPPADTGSTR